MPIYKNSPAPQRGKPKPARRTGGLVFPSLSYAELRQDPGTGHSDRPPHQNFFFFMTHRHKTTIKILITMTAG